MAAKKCSKCGVEKPLDQFHRQKWCKQGVRPDCKACAYKASKARYTDEDRREKRLQYRLRNREKLIARDKKYYEQNKAVLIPKMVEYNRRNREAYLAKMRAWRKANPEKVQVWIRNRRAKLKGLNGSHTIQDIHSLLQSQTGLCVYCKIDISKQFQVDHIVPVSRGGRNDVSNLQLLCKQCNLDKRDKDPIEYLRTIRARSENGRRISDPSGVEFHIRIK